MGQQQVGTGKHESTSECAMGHMAMPQSHQNCIHHIKVSGVGIIRIIMLGIFHPCLFVNTMGGGLQLILELFSNVATCLPPAALTWGDDSSQVTSAFVAPPSSIVGTMGLSFKHPSSKPNGSLKRKKAIKKRGREGDDDIQASTIRPSSLLGSDTTRTSPPSI